MRKLNRFFSLKWQILLFTFSIVLFLLSLFFLKDLFLIISSFILITAFFSMVCAVVFHLIKKNWKTAIALILPPIIFFAVVCQFGFLLYLIIEGRHDEFTDELVIPKNISISQPLEEMDSSKISSGLHLYKSVQPGIYRYVYVDKNLSDGKIFLKAFEITKNQPLSAERLRSKSLIEIRPGDSIFQFENDFTIYEGDWGYPYAARFEVWHESPNNVTRKIADRNFIIEGWQR
ncbi:MAG: hypothetical protein CFE23_02045 [Flavobacterium sp. BFFFF1]|uniref:hypothetical protein n=1 Tax=Flavobacterium sp. BFFFF1 TaxID=2015557 RepID=UPI000BCF8421|nr:hypothetical protein [Flavobacterium sp. BFFFF1]OYU82100.1 MAG: hypothetical protein CFE23_02045 [Flavobacterium sp. BFFFF1]